MKMRQIAIDFDIHKRIETERRSFDETENEILRRILGLPENLTPTPSGYGTEKSVDRGLEQSFARSWWRKGVELPEGTRLRLVYPGVHASGRIRNGAWDIEGEREVFRSPSKSACTIVSKNRGREISLNGWLHWEARRPSDSDWVLLNALRDKGKIDRRHR